MREDSLEELMEEMLSEGAKEYVNRKTDEIEAPEVSFSKEHEAKMQQLFSSINRSNRVTTPWGIAKKVAVFLIASLLILGGLVGVVDALKKKNNYLQMEEHNANYMNITFRPGEKEEESSQKSEENHYFTENIRFWYLPEGFKLENQKVLEDIQYYCFSNLKEYLWIRIDKRTDFYHSTDIEDAKKEMIVIHNQQGLKLEKEEQVLNYFWKDDQYYYEVESNLPEEEVLKIIEKIEILKNF